MNRREVLQRTAAVLGYAVTGPVLAGIMNGCKAKPELAYKPDFFNEDQARLVGELCEVIIPRTETPGAKDAGVPGFIDGMIKEVYPPEGRDAFMKGMTEFNDAAKKNFGSDFSECSQENKAAHVKAQLEEALAKRDDGASWGWWRGGGQGSKPFIIEMKELTLTGFFTSEPGATQVLQYNQVPGPFQGCVPLEKVGKTWAT